MRLCSTRFSHKHTSRMGKAFCQALFASFSMKSPFQNVFPGLDSRTHIYSFQCLFSSSPWPSFTFFFASARLPVSSPQVWRRKGVGLRQAVYLKGPGGSRLLSAPQQGCHLTMYLFTHLAKNFSYRPHWRSQAGARETCM